MAVFVPRVPQREAIYGNAGEDGIDGYPGIFRTWKETSRNAAVILPTGVGKTGLFLYLANMYFEKGARVLIIAHRKELLTQPLDSLRLWFPKAAKATGTVKGSTDEYDKRIVLASTPTLWGKDGVRLDRVLSAGAFNLVIYDEGHHSVSEGAVRVLERLDEAAVAEFGKPPLKLCVTATPERGDSKELGSYWSLAYSYPIDRAWKDGYLVPRWYGDETLGGRAVVERLPGEPELENMSEEEQAAYFDKYSHLSDEEIGAALVEGGIVEHTVEMMRKWAVGPNAHTIGPSDRLKSVVFTAGVEQARLTAEALRADGWKASYISGNTSKGARNRILRALRLGKLDVVCNCGVLTEGFDDPTILAVVIARPCGVPGLYRQIVGRGLRKCDDLGNGVAKTECLELDLSGASIQHSLRQANVLLENPEKDKRGPRLSEDPIGAITNMLGSMVKSREPFTDFEIHDIPGFFQTVRAVDCGDRGGVLVFVTPNGEEQFKPYRVYDGQVEDLAPGMLVDEEWYSEVASDLARRAARASKSRSKSTSKRGPNLTQRRALAGLQVPGRFQLSGVEAGSHIRVYEAVEPLLNAGRITKDPRKWRLFNAG